MKKDIRFVDAQEMHKEHPLTFDAPDKEQLDALKPGDFVKVCAYEERFWTEIIKVEGESVTARIDNILLTPRLTYNETITFVKNNVYDIIDKEKLEQQQKNSIQRFRRKPGL